MATDRELLARLDERTQALDEKLDEIVASIRSDREHYVKKSEFAPIQKAVYSAIGLICTGFILAVIALIVGDAAWFRSFIGK